MLKHDGLRAGCMPGQSGTSWSSRSSAAAPATKSAPQACPTSGTGGASFATARRERLSGLGVAAAILPNKVQARALLT